MRLYEEGHYWRAHPGTWKVLQCTEHQHWWNLGKDLWYQVRMGLGASIENCRSQEGTKPIVGVTLGLWRGEDLRISSF